MHSTTFCNFIEMGKHLRSNFACQFVPVHLDGNVFEYDKKIMKRIRNLFTTKQNMKEESKKNDDGQVMDNSMLEELKLQSEVEGSEQRPLETNSSENLSIELAELKEQHLRLYAEFDNYKKRSLKERMEFLKTAGSEMLISMLPVLDDFERAIKATAEMDDKNPMSEGVLLVYNKFKGILEQKGLKPMKSVGVPFDADLQEAISSVPVEDAKMKGMVIDEIEKGYTFNDKVIRHAKVVVGI